RQSTCAKPWRAPWAWQKNRRSRSSLDLAAGAGVGDQCSECVERRLGGIGVSVCCRIEPFLAVADRGMGKSYPAVEPWSAAEAADHRDFHCGDNGRSGNRPRIGEIKE